MHKITCLFALFIVQWIWAQEITIRDRDTGEPLMNVAVFNEDRSRTSISNFNGKCELDGFDLNERITFRHLSYQALRITRAQALRQGNTVYLTIKPEQLEEVVMSVSKWEQQKKDIPLKIASIDARSIAFNAPQTSADLLQSSGQVFVQKSQLGGGSPMIRGFATNRLLLSVDGVRMNNAIFRGGNIQNVISIDPFSVKRTEIIFGPGSVIYGSDAIGGVMNFYTLNPEFAVQEGETFSGGLNYRHSTANNENTVHADLNFGKRKWAFLSSLSYNDFGDMLMGRFGPDSYLQRQYVKRMEGRDTLLANPDPGKQVPTGYSQWNLMQKISHKPNNSWNIDLGLYYSGTSDFPRYDRLIRPGSGGEGLRSAEWYYGPQNWFMGNLQLLWKGREKFFDRLKTTVAYQRFGESRYDRDFGSPLRYANEEAVDALSMNLDFENKKIGDLRLYYGSEYVYNYVSSEGSTLDIDTGERSGAPSRYPDGAEWQTAAAYLNAEYKAKPNLSLLSGLRYSHVWMQADFDRTYYPFPFENANLNNGALTGSFGVSWFPKADLQLTLNGATGFRSPNIDDIGKVFDSEPGSVVVPNPDLEPEYAYSAEFGVMKNFNDKLVFKGAAYYTHLVDALVRRDFSFNGQNEIIYNGEPSNVQAIQNAARVYIYGFEFGMEAYMTEKLSITSNLTFTRGYEEDNSGEDTPARHVPPTFGDVHLIWKNHRLKTDLFFNFNGEIAYDDLSLSEHGKDYIYAADANGNPYSPSWHTLNFRSRYQISNKLHGSLNLENLSNQRYRPYSSGIAAVGINLVLGVDYAF
jgi:hemoglobin/transferrin/lactoferrin receptor protein